MAIEEEESDKSWEMYLFLALLFAFSKLTKMGSSSFKTTCCFLCFFFWLVKKRIDGG
jgi:hypothetical protein